MSTVTEGTMTTYLPEGLPRPDITPSGLDAEFWNGAEEQRLMVQTCAACGEAQWPPEEICAGCHSFDRTWKQSEATGTIYSWTRIWHPVHPSLQNAGPYLVVVVELKDFPIRIVGNLLGDPLQHVETAYPVRAVFERQDAGHTLVQWKLDLPKSGGSVPLEQGTR